ncbi:DNA-directed RNA polymerase subunit RPC12/RpoP [Streptomyces sp. SAI-208]|uniref:hypothetical protein n=1 Tax=Streptomyces sp. SAI-208 TaxID=2940550 RepID=UPI0024739AA1|nr:hypothetical protein [Streptomyces sp. SAI-208]MDH6607470.1 DNA-directed RNA polymerase subunit RPC12/RpoP [Streptomyces sp. SAI-208]
MTSPPGDDGHDGDHGHDGGPSGGETETKPPPLVCARCGTPTEGPPPTWTCSVENGVRQYFCDTCSRENLRAIEGRLDSAWW